MPEERLELSLPEGNWILNPESQSRNDQSSKEIHDDNNPVVPTMVPTSPAANSTLPDDPDLARLLVAWPCLPKAIRAGILAMVRAAESKT